jgi:hypothetical protein
VGQQCDNRAATGEEVLSPEELVGMSLEHIKRICEESNGVCVYVFVCVCVDLDRVSRAWASTYVCVCVCFHVF